MENINIGIVNLVVSNKLKNSYFDDSFINETKNIVNNFFEVVKNSPILQLEFKVYSNIEGKHIDNDLVASRYIDNNIKLFEVYTLDEIQNEHRKLNEFVGSEIPAFYSTVEQEKLKLYNSINILIYESLNDYSNIDVDKIHESFTHVLNHIKTPKVKSTLNENHILNEEVIEIAVEKFNEKYQSLNEDDKNLIKTLIKSTIDEKKELLESYKKETILMLEKHNIDSTKDSITKAMSKINEMTFNSDNVDDDIISLHDLKKDLI